MSNPESTTPLEITPEIESAAADWVTRSDAGLSAGEEERFQNWLEEDPRHAEAFAHLQEAWSVFDRVEEGGVVDAVLEGLDQRSKTRRKRRLKTITASAAAVVAILWVGLWLPRGETEVRPMERSSTEQLAYNESARRLPDGSVVELKEGAEIEVNYQPDARHVRLVKGEAFFRVAKDATRPFYVEAHGVEVRAVGTAFSVQMSPGAVDVIVKEGAVDVGRSQAADQKVVRVPAGKRFTALIRLIPARQRFDETGAVGSEEKEQVAESPMTEPQALPETEINRQLAWRKTLQEFSGNTLDEAAALMNHQNITQILIKDPVVGRLRVSGYFRADNPEGLVRIVEATFDLQAEKLDAHTILLKAGR